MITSLIYLTLGLLITLGCRKPARKWLGASPAFALWLLPPLLAALPLLPSVPLAWTTVPTTLVLPAARALVAQATPDNSTMNWMKALWLAGTLVCLLRLVVRHAALVRTTRPIPAAMLAALRTDIGRLDGRLLRLHADGPAVLWSLRSVLLLPPDFLERFDGTGRRLVLQHELAHLGRGDTWWNLLAELAAAALWFHPLAWLAMPRFRLDQELACDETVLRLSPGDGQVYANTLLESLGLGRKPAPMLIPWLAEPQLKERLTMIQRFRPGAVRRHLGFIGIASLMLGVAAVSQAAVTVPDKQSATADAAYNSAFPPPVSG